MSLSSWTSSFTLLSVLRFVRFIRFIRVLRFIRFLFLRVLRVLHDILVGSSSVSPIHSSLRTRGRRACSC